MDLEKRKFELDKLEFEKAILLRNFEIDNFWKRAWFFGALLIALLGAFFTLKNANQPYLAICVSFIAFLTALIQGLMNRGSKYWQERWEYVTKNKEATLNINLTRARNLNYKFDKNGNSHYFERGMIDICIRAKDESFLTRGARWSVSKLTFLIWDIITISCLCLWLRECLLRGLKIQETGGRIAIELVIFHLLIIAYILVFYFFKGKAYERLSEPQTYSTKNPQDKSEYYKLSESYVDNTDFETAIKAFKDHQSK